MSRSRLPAVAVASALVAGLLLPVAAQAAAKPAAKPARPGPNLIVNPGFEQSALEGTPAAPPGSLTYPLLPVGWVFEGATVLFDHSSASYHTGKRGAAISGSLSTNRQLCETGTCQPNPVNPARAVVYPYYSLAPAWRTQAPIPVKAGTKYLMSAWVSWIVETLGEGAVMNVRWLDANGMPISLVPVVTKRSRASDSAELTWTQVSGTTTAPAGAVSAELLFGATDDNWTGQVRYDDTYFGTAPVAQRH